MANKIKLHRTFRQKKTPPQGSGRGGGSFHADLLQEALAHHQAGRLPQAEACYRQILAVEPNHPDALNLLGMLAHQTGQSEIAVELISRAVSYRPNYPEAYDNLGYVLLAQGKTAEAIPVYQKLLGLRPNHVQAHYNLGIALQGQGRLEEAVASNRRALTLKPDYVEAHFNLGSTLQAQGKLDEAIVSYRRALTLRADYVEAQSNLLFCLSYLGKNSIADYLEEARLYGRKAAAKVRERFSTWTCPPAPERLRVGLISGDLRNHPVGYFLENVLPHLAATQIELLAYPTHQHEDALTRRMRSHFVGWKSLAGMNDEAAARLIRADGVHVLLDLSGHTKHNRLPIFAWRPAPVQATWLGYFASTGIAEMDYLLADPVSVPESCQGHFTEQVWYLPETRLCFSPPAASEELAVTPLPALANGYVTFGCFQKLDKINEAVIAVWGRVLQALPQSRLYLQNRALESPVIREQLQRQLAQSGIAPERVRLEKAVPRKEYLAAHAEIDIILDTFPFPGGTTTCEALWMGVPTMTLAGNTMLARQGASLLSCAGLADWVATDEEGYVATAVAHATDLAQLALLRAGLREQVLASPLFDGPRFARNFEAAMWGMWRRYRGES